LPQRPKPGRPKAAAGDAPDAKPHHVGHRRRLRDRFLASPQSLPDYELLELLLFQAIPRRDTKPLAKRLLARFDGDLARLANAGDAELKAVDGVGEAAIAVVRLFGEGARRLLRHRVQEQPVLGSWTQLLDYLRVAQGAKQTEQFRLLFLDAKNRLVADEVHQTGTIDETPVYPREVAKRALELGAAALIVVHNHPSGDPTPSKADIAITKEIAAALATLNIQLHDHLILGRGKHASLRTLGLL
jgi:DNA repair protein RadC